MSSNAPFRARVRLPSSKLETLVLSRPVTIRSLLTSIHSLLQDVEISQIGLKIAYPSKVVELGAPETWDRDITDIGIKNGETLMVTISEEPHTKTPQPNASVSAKSLSGLVQTASSLPVQTPSLPIPEPLSMEPLPPWAKNLISSVVVTPTAEKRPSILPPAGLAPPAKRFKEASLEAEPPEIDIEGGTVVLRVMEDDNSCMFSAFIYCMGKGKYTPLDLRAIVVKKILQNPVRFNAATLGSPVNDYCAWILRPTSWGGEIELAILSEYFQIGVDCVDVKTGHVFSYGESCPTRCILIYSGIHYDAIAYTFASSMPDADITLHRIFPPSEPNYALILAGAKQLAQKLKERGYNVDTATFNICCEECGDEFVGEKEAMSHAQTTGHTGFGQIPDEEEDV